MKAREKMDAGAAWLDRQHRRLQAELDEVGKTMEHQELELRTMGTSDPTERGDIAEEEEEDQEVAETLISIRARYEGIVEALRRMEAGSYGTCADCGDDIPRRRLQFLPSAVRCIACAGGRRFVAACVDHGLDAEAREKPA